MARHLINNITLLKFMVDELITHKRLAHDTETYGPSGIGGLHAFHGSRSFSHIFATDKDEYYVDFNNKIDWKYKKLLQTIFDDPTRIIFYVNAIFDGCISHFDGLKFNQRIIDCPSIARIDFNKHGKSKDDKDSYLSMEYLANYYKVKIKDDAVKNYIAENNLYQTDENGGRILDIFKGEKIPEYQKVPFDLMYSYGCNDARTTYDLGIKILKCLNYKDTTYAGEREVGMPKMIDVAKREVELTSVLLDTKIKGVRHWEYYTKKAVIQETKNFKLYNDEIQKLTGGINLNSGMQVGKYLQAQGVEVPRNKPTDIMLTRSKTWLAKAVIAKKQGKEKQYHQAMEKALHNEKGNFKTDAETLERLMGQHAHLEGIDKISKTKKAEKKLNTYYKNFLTLQDFENYIHADLNQNAAKTGRFSSSNPNLQNLHKESWLDDKGKVITEWLIRKSFIADDGSRLFFTDFRQQEMIVMLDQAGEMSVINKLKSGEFKDFYLATAAVLKEVLGIDISRKDAKAMALGLAYGKGTELLAYELGYILPNATEAEIDAAKKKAGKFKRAFFDALPNLKRFTKRLEREVKMYGKIHNAFGRVIYLDSNEAYKALNAFVQSTSADITKQAIVDLEKDLTKNKLKSRFTICIHDELCTNVVLGEEKVVLPMIRNAMINAYTPRHMGLDVDFEVSEINEKGVSPWGEKVAYNLAA